MAESDQDRSSFWEATRRELDELAEALRQDRVPDPALIDQILTERARRLAEPPPPPSPRDLVEVVVFTLAREAYAVEADLVGGVTRVSDYAALPGAPPPIAGLTAHRGELLPLLDIRANLGLQPTALDDLGRIVVLRDDETRAGVFVDGVEGLRNIRTSELSPPPDRGTADRNLFRGITPDILALLDAREILRLFAGGDDS